MAAMATGRYQPCKGTPSYIPFRYLVAVLLLVMFMILPLQGQGQTKKVLEAKDYGLWGRMYLDKISSNGNWISYRLDHSSQQDTLFVKSRDGKKTYRFATAGSGNFCGEKCFAFVDEEQRLTVLELISGRLYTVDHVTTFSFAGNGSFLVTQETSAADSKVIIRKIDGLVVVAIEDAVSYSHNPANDDLLCFVSTPLARKVVATSLQNPKVQELIAEKATGVFAQFTWQPKGSNVAFIHQEESKVEGQQENQQERSPNNTLYYYQKKKKKCRVFSASRMKNYPAHTRIADPIMSRLTVSKDGKKVFFGIQGTQERAVFHDDSLQIWKGNAIRIYPEERFSSKWETVPDLAVWWPEKETFLQITNKERPVVFFNGNHEFAISYNPNTLGPQYKLQPDADYYITHLESGITKPWLERQSTEMNDMSIAPDGTSIAYYRDRNYWVYHFYEGTHTNVTALLGNKWQEDDVLGVSDNYGIAGWGSGSTALLVYDAWDLWVLDAKGKKGTRITNGYRDGSRYRLVSTQEKGSSKTFHRENDPMIALEGRLLFRYAREQENGYKLLDANTWQTVSVGEMSFSTIKKAANNETFAFLTQRFDVSPDIWVTDTTSRRPTVLARSNTFQSDYLWGRAEVIDYENKAGKKLKGVLYYPAGYDSRKKYPMVVSIYDKQLQYLYSYFEPSLENIIGFNITNFTANGYLVLRPDIVYERNDPGISAADCTIAATRAVIDKGVVDTSGIGLIGHSFGGYEVNFIITQTGLFSAAVSGAGISDLASFYLSVGWSMGMPEIFRFENQQWRMDRSFFEDPESYLRNSPIMHAKKITTPLLLWTGEKDNQVNYNQSISFYLALRRLGKQNMLLVYPNEGHAITTPRFQKDLTEKVQDWFDHYLKAEHQNDWILDGIR